MELGKDISQAIKGLLVNTVRNKIENYSPETAYKPFHTRLVGGDKYAIFSFIQSLNTAFGMSIWEQVSVLLAKNVGYDVERQYKLLGEINAESITSIEKTHSGLRSGEREPDTKDELKILRKSRGKGRAKVNPDSTVDVYIKIGKKEYYIDITSAKSNQKEFVELKRKLLKWEALRISTNKNANVYPRLAIPYNPYYPEPYERWTMSGLFDLKRDEIMIGDDYWNFVGGGKIYDGLLNVFEEAGNELRTELENKFAEFK